MTATQAFRRDQRAVRARALRDLLDIWPAFDPDDPDAYLAGARAVVARGHETAAALAGGYVRAVGREQGLRAVPVTLAVLSEQQAATSLRITSVIRYRAALGAGVGPQAARQAALVQQLGAASRLILGGGRQTVVQSVRTAGARWQRVTSGNACDFCTLLAGRGAVYAEETSDFAAHDHCGCSAEPIYRQR